MGAIVKNKLKFDIVELNSCLTMGILDNSSYTVDDDLVQLPTLQILIPSYGDTPVEVSYYPHQVTILNSNNLQLSNVADPKDYIALPDGLWTIKQTICPFEDNWFEKKFYRICQLECKFYNAFLELELNKCEDCWNDKKYQKLRNADVYIKGIKANVSDCNFKKATQLYEKADKILDDLTDCKCKNNDF